MQQNMNIKEATQHWVRGFNAIPQGFIENALGDKLWDEFVEQYPELKVCPQCGHEYTEEEHEELLEESEENGLDHVTCKHCTSTVTMMDYQEYSSDISCNGFLPMWGWMWTFEESIDDEWALENLDTMYKLGFRVYEHEDLGVVIGIDGAGYDFYDAHWIPLYKARGLRWHTQE